MAGKMAGGTCRSIIDRRHHWSKGAIPGQGLEIESLGLSKSQPLCVSVVVTQKLSIHVVSQ